MCTAVDVVTLLLENSAKASLLLFMAGLAATMPFAVWRK